MPPYNPSSDYYNYCSHYECPYGLQGPPGPRGPIGPPGPPGAAGKVNYSYAQYSIYDFVNNANNLPLHSVFDVGGTTSLLNNTTIQLKKGYIYLISYIVQGTPGADSSFQIVPIINSGFGSLYSGTANTNTTSPNASVSGSFITTSASNQAATLSFSLGTSAATAIYISGSVSIIAIAQVS